MELSLLFEGVDRISPEHDFTIPKIIKNMKIKGVNKNTADFRAKDSSPHQRKKQKKEQKKKQINQVMIRNKNQVSLTFLIN